MLLVAAATARAVAVQPEVAETGSVIVTADSAEVREGPSHTYDVVTVVEKGEVFLKQGRTKGWYLIKINDESSGWVSGRAISRYRAEGSAPPYVRPYDSWYYPYYPGGYYDYPYSYWGQPYLSWEWYFYDGDRHRDRSWDRSRDHDRDDRRDRDRDRPRGDEWRADEDRPRGDGRSRDGDWRRDDDSHRGGDIGPRANPQPRSSGPRIRSPFPRR
jgi:uncharacterized protein YraI